MSTFPGYQVPNIRIEGGCVIVQIKIKGHWFTGAAVLHGNLNDNTLSKSIQKAKEDALYESEKSDFVPYSDRPEPTKYSGGGGNFGPKKPKEAKCKFCESPIAFFKNETTGKLDVVDYSSVKVGDKAVNFEYHVKHNCKKIDQPIAKHEPEPIKKSVSEVAGVSTKQVVMSPDSQEAIRSFAINKLKKNGKWLMEYLNYPHIKEQIGGRTWYTMTDQDAVVVETEMRKLLHSFSGGVT